MTAAATATKLLDSNLLLGALRGKTVSASVWDGLEKFWDAERAPAPIRPDRAIRRHLPEPARGNARQPVGPDDFLSLQQVAARWNVSVKHVRQKIADGDLRYVDVSKRGSKNRKIRIKLDDLKECETRLAKRDEPVSPESTAKARRTNKSRGGEVISFTQRRLLKKKSD